MPSSTPTRTLALFAAVAGTLGLLFNVLVFDVQPGLGLTLFGFCVAASVLGFSLYTKKMIEKPVLIFSLSLMFFSAQFVVRDSTFITIISIIVSLFILCLLAFFGSHALTTELPFAKHLHSLWMPLESITNGVTSFAELIGRRTEFSTDSRPRAIVRGLLLSLPILFVFTLLFANADKAFFNWVKPLFDIDFFINEETVWRMIFITLITLLCLGAYTIMFLRAPKHLVHTNVKAHPFLKPTETIVLLSSINALFFVFLLSQFTYFFGGDAARQSLDISYAEYAVSGFTELNLIAVCSFAILHLAERAFASHRERYSKAFQGVYALMIIQLFAIMASSFYRLVVYEQAYGYTVKRLLSQAFIVFLAVCFGLLLEKVALQRVTKQLGYTYILLSLSFWVIVVAAHPELIATKLNIKRFEQTGKIDAVYLTQNLSTERIHLVQEIETSLPPYEKRYIHERMEEYQSSIKHHDQDWRAWNLSRALYHK